MTTATVDLYWLPLGAGGHSVRLNGRVYEAVLATVQRRTACALYHSALRVRDGASVWVIEMAPVRRGDGRSRGVVAEGPVGDRRLGSLSAFRYEVRRWRDGVIPDVDEAVESPQPLSASADDARRLLSLVPSVPRPTWGRDELGTGDMWNSNSIVSWLLVRSGIGIDRVALPGGGRAPGWRAGVAVAERPGLLRSVVEESVGQGVANEVRAGG